MPAPRTQFDRELLLRLPLPFAQLVRRAHNAPDARARHNNAFFLFEATIKLTASVLVAGYARCLEHGEPRNNSLDRPLEALQRPALGHWVAIVRELSRHFGRRPDSSSHPLGHLAAQLQEPRRECAAMLDLYRRIKNGPDSQPAADQSCSLLALFDALTAYRNTIIGHGADRCDEFYEQTMGPLLLPAAADVLAEGRFDFLGPPGSRLVYLGEVRKLDDARFEVGLRELLGGGSMRVEPLPISAAEQATILPNRLAVLWRGHAIPLRLDPLLVYREAELNEEVRFLNSDRDGKQVEYLSYTSGKTERDPTTVADLARLLELITGQAPEHDAESAAVAAPPVERDFEILAEIGRGGMGVIYLARQISLGRLVALKMLPAELSGDEVALARFNREIRALGQCDDPHIVKVLTSGKMPDGQRYYAMEYVPGADLDTVWHELTGSRKNGNGANLGGTTWSRAVLTACRHKRTETLQRASAQTSSGRAGATTAGTSAAMAPAGETATPQRIQSPEAAELLAHLAPLPELPAADENAADYHRRVAMLIRDAARALQTVHDQGIVHRDVKPANLMLTADGGRVVLMDFGLAKGNTRTLEASRSAGLLGTLRYAAPEQLAAAQIKVGPKTDVRGLGVTLFELLTRRHLFEQAADEKQLTSWILTKPVPKLRSINPALDADLEAIVAAATEPAQDDRLTARQLADLLDLYLAGKPLPIRLPSLAEMLRRWIRDNRGTFAAATAAAATILVGVAVAFALVNAAKDDAETAEAAQLAGANANLAIRERNAHEQTETQLYYSNIALAAAKWRDCRVDQTLQILDQCRADLRDWEWNYLRRACQAGFDVEHVAGITGNEKVLAVSPAGDLVAATDGKTIRLLHRRGDPKAVKELPGGTGEIINLVFSPDGEHLASAAEVSNANEKKTGEIKLWHLPDNKELFKTAIRAAPVGGGSPVFSPNGHGADRCDEFYEQTMGPLLLPAAADVLAEGRFDFLGPPGSRLVYLGEVRKLDDARFEVGLRELLGGGSMRVEPLPISAAEQATILPNRLAVLWRGHAIPLRLDPLLVYREAELNEEVRFLNSDRDGKQVEYLSYTSGKTERDPTTVADLARLLELITGQAPEHDAESAAVAAPPVERDFEILAEIGRGGMGVIYLARQISLGRLVALKMLPAELSGDEVALARFNREIRALGQCDDPHIVKVLTSGKMPDGQRYYAMEYVPGADLDTVWHELTGSRKNGNGANLGGTTWSRAVLTACRHKRTETLQRASAQTSSGRAGATTAGTSAAMAPAGETATPQRIQSPEAAELLAHLAPLPELPAADENAADYHRRVAMLIRDAARALQTVHDQGIVHRDVKPANLMLTADGGRVVLMDFGLAKGNTRTLEASRSAGLLGTLRYAAPEQLAAAQIKVGPKTDVRGLGVTLFELLTRRHLFEQAADEKQLTSWILTKPVPKLRSINPALDADLEAIVAAATEPAQDDRLTARQLADLLDLYLAGKPLPIRLPSLAEMLRRWIRDNRGTFAAATAAAATILVGVAVAFALVNAAKDDAETAREKAAQLAGANANLAIRERNAHEQTETQLYYSNIALAAAKWRDCRVDQTLQILDQCRADLRDWEWNYLRRACQAGFDVEHVAGITGNEKVLAVSPAGDLVAATDGKTIRLLHRRGDPKAVKELPGGTGEIINLVFSPDGEHLASAAEVSNANEKKTGEIKLWHLPDNKELFKTAIRAAPVGGGSPVFSPNGQELIAADLNLAHIYDLTGNEVLSVPGRPVLVFSVALSPNRKTLALGGAKVGENGYEGGVVHLWNLETGANDKTLKVSATFVQHLVFSDDSKYLAVAGFDNAVSVWDVQTGNELGLHADHTKRVIGMAFFDDLIVSAAEDKTLRVWQWKTSNGALATTETTPLRMPTSAVAIAQYKGGGTLFAIDKQGTVYTWKGERQDYTQCQRHNRPIFAVAFNSNGSLVASRGFGGRLKVYQWKSRKEVFSLDGQDAAESSVVFSPDGHWLAINVEEEKKDSAIVVFDAQSWKEAFRFTTGKAKLRQLVFDPESRRLAAFDDASRQVRIWDFQAAGGKQLAETHPPCDGPIAGMCFSRDGAKLATADKSGVRTWNARTGDLTKMLPKGETISCRDVAFNADGTLVACVVDSRDGPPRLAVYSTETGEKVSPSDRQEFRFNSGMVNPSGSRMVVFTADDGARIIETKTSRELTTFPKWGTTRAALFSPDGHFIAAAADSEDILGPGSVRLFDGSPPIEDDPK